MRAPLSHTEQIANPGTGVITVPFLRWLEQFDRESVSPGGSDFLEADNNLSDVNSASASRVNLGLGTIAVQSAASVSITGGAISGLTSLVTDTLTFAGTLTANVTTVTGLAHSAGNEFLIRVDDDAAGGDVTVSLPASVAGRVYHVKKLGTTGNVIIDPDGSETIDGAATEVIATQYESRQVVSNGAGWDII